MEKLLGIIAYFPDASIAIVASLISAIIAIAAIKIANKPKRNEEQRNEEQRNGNKHNQDSVTHLYLLLAIFFIAGVWILWIAYPGEDGETPETTPQASMASQQTIPETDPTESGKASLKTISELQKSDFAYVAASSTYDGDRATHIATNLIDGKRETNWTEGVDGNGIGEYVQFEFQEKQTITGFQICSGNHSSDSYYTKNARPEKIKLTFEDGNSEEFSLLDVKEELTFQLSEPVATKTVRLTIQSVYKGSSWEDTVISEIVFLAAK